MTHVLSGSTTVYTEKCHALTIHLSIFDRLLCVWQLSYAALSSDSITMQTPSHCTCMAAAPCTYPHTCPHISTSTRHCLPFKKRLLIHPPCNLVHTRRRHTIHIYPMCWCIAPTHNLPLHCHLILSRTPRPSIHTQMPAGMPRCLPPIQTQAASSHLPPPLACVQCILQNQLSAWHFPHSSARQQRDRPG